MLLAGMVSMFLLASAFVIFFLIYKRRITQQQFKLQEAELHFERKLLQSTIATQERERKRFASDLHDDIGGSILAAMLSVSQIEQQASDATFVEKQASQTHESLQQVLQQVRTVSHNLVPPSMAEFGLTASLEDLITSLSGKGVKINFQSRGPLPDLKYETAIALYRIAKEWLSNALKHASASEIEVRLSRESNYLNLSVKDNGRGYDHSQQPKGAGLRNIMARSRQIGGKLDTLSTKTGTHNRIRVPLTHNLHES